MSRWRCVVLFTAVEESGGHGSEHDGDLNMGISFGLGCNYLFLFLDEFDVFLDVLHVLLEGWRGAEHTLTALQLLESLVSILHLLTLTKLQVPKRLVVAQRLIDGGELFPGMQLLEKAAVVTDGTRPCLHHHHQDLVVQRLSDEKEDGGYAVTIESVQRCVEKCSLLIHALVPLQAVGLA
jgi:hypothetical protein